MPSATSPLTGDPLAATDDRRWLTLIVVAVAQLMVVLDATIVNIALPSAQRALGFPNSDRQWVVTAYALAFGSLLLVGGRLGDMFSRRRVFIIGLIGFAVASAIGGASVSFTMLAAARALQGAFAAILAPAALAALVGAFREPRERGRAFGVFGSVAAGGGAVGLVLGGLLTQYLSWRWTLYVNLLFAAIAVAGALAWMRPSRPDVRPLMDWPGTVLGCAGLFLIVFGFSRAETAGWTAPETIASLAAGVVLVAGFAVAEQRSRHPLLPLRVILDLTRGGSYVAVFISGIAIFATFLFLTYYLQVIKGESPLATGLLFLPMTGCILITSNLSSIVGLARVGPRALVATGMLLGAGAMAYLTRVTVTSGYASAVLPALLVLGLGFGLIFAPAINTATFGVARRDSGVASALVNTMQQVGGSIGTSALSTIALSTAASYLITHRAGPHAPAVAATRGYTVAFGLSAAMLALGLVLAIVLLPSKRRLAELRTAAPAAPAPATAAPALAKQPGVDAIPVALCSCSPVVTAPAALSGHAGPLSEQPVKN